jgi:hypothetical protein
MKIYALNRNSSTQFDLNAFSHDLKELSDRHGITLESFGAMQTNTSENKMMFIAMWSANQKPVQD